MTVAALLASALGGGIIAALLEAWFSGLRQYETARLLVLGDLEVTRALSIAIGDLGEPVSPGLAARLRYPTGAWMQNRALLATRLARREDRLFERLSAFFAIIEAVVPNTPLEGEPLKNLDELRAELPEATLGIVGESVVYGPRAAITRYRRRRARRELEAGAATGAQTGTQEP